jgi:2-aminobenzoate-CoA ligase
VLECAVIGEPCAERGQLVRALVVPRDPARADAALARSIQDRVKTEIAPYKYPRQVEFVASLPRTESGKLQRFRLHHR